MSLYITQLIYLKENQEQVFLDFESKVLPLLQKHDGKLLIRMNVNAQHVISAETNLPYELHLVEFKDEWGFKSYMADPDRQKYVHMKEQSVAHSLNIVGKLV